MRPYETDVPGMFDPYLTLGDIIERLEREDPLRVLPVGFTNPHSFRGDYCDLAFEPAQNIRVEDVLDAARSAVGATYEGWKGGSYTMTEHSRCWISYEGESSDNAIGPLLLELLLRSGSTKDGTENE
jgi:hypothetical protein